ncbi:hypothetical protein HP10700_08472 [Helicobacter pylori 10700]|nr:hypothetical protein HP10700_08472 [Helicobacter pylori 10700]
MAKKIKPPPEKKGFCIKPLQKKENLKKKPIKKRIQNKGFKKLNPPKKRV